MGERHAATKKSKLEKEMTVFSFFLSAASGVARSRCTFLRGPLCAGEALLEARTQASVALFKLGAHSAGAALRPEFGGP